MERNGLTWREKSERLNSVFEFEYQEVLSIEIYHWPVSLAFIFTTIARNHFKLTCIVFYILYGVEFNCSLVRIAIEVNSPSGMNKRRYIYFIHIAWDEGVLLGEGEWWMEIIRNVVHTIHIYFLNSPYILLVKMPVSLLFRYGDGRSDR